MVRATWYFCLVVAVTVAATAASHAESHRLMRQNHRVSARSRGRELSDRRRASPFHSADVLHVGRSRVSRRAVSKAKKGVEDDPMRRIIGNKKAARLAVSRAIEELDALEEKPGEGVPAPTFEEETSHLKPEAAEGEESLAPTTEEGQDGYVLKEETGNGLAPSEARQVNDRFSPPQAAPGNRVTPEVVPEDRFSPQAAPEDQFSSEAGKNRFTPDVNGGRFMPQAGKSSQVDSKRKENNLGPKSNRFTPEAEQEESPSEAGKKHFASVKSKYAIPDVGSMPFSPETGDKNVVSPKLKGVATKEGNKNQFSSERTHFAPEEGDISHLSSTENHFIPQPSTNKSSAPESSRETKHSSFPTKLTNNPKRMTRPVINNPGQANGTLNGEASVTPGEEGNMNPREKNSSAESQGRGSTFSTEPQWLAWYNTRPWRQEILSEYGEGVRPSRTAFGL